MDIKRVSRLIERIYCAGMGQMPWSDVLAEMARSGRQSHPNEIERDLEDSAPHSYGSYGLDPESGAPYMPGFGLIEVWHSRLTTRPALGSFANDWLTNQRTSDAPGLHGNILGYQTFDEGFGALDRRAPDSELPFKILLSRHGRLPTRDQKLISILVPHIRRSLQLQNAIRQARKTAEAETGASLLQLGLIVLAADGRVTFANRSAIDILLRMGVSLAAGRLSGMRTEADGVVEAIEDAAAAGTAQFAKGPFFMTMSIDRRTEVDLVLASEDDKFAGSGEPGIALTLRLRTGHDLSEKLKSAFRLTPSEAALAISLSRGETLADIARSRGTSVNTVRVQLRSAFAKTGCHRQSDLMRLVLRLPRR